MSHHQPAGWACRALLADDTAPHQLRVQVGYWSCTCQQLGPNAYLPLGDLGDGNLLTPEEIHDAHRQHLDEVAA